MRAPALTLALAATLALPLAAAPRYGPDQVGSLVEIAQSEAQPEARRAQAVRQLEYTDLRTQMPALRKLLREERSLDIRLSAACVLAALGDRKSPRDLLLATAYEGGRTPSCTRGDVVTALARLADPAAEMHLERALTQPAPEDEPGFHAEVCRALGLLDTPGSRRLLLAALRDGAADVRLAAIQPLAAVARDPRCPDRKAAVGALAQAAQRDTEEKVAERAMSALLWNSVDGAGFYRLLERSPEPAVRARAARVMNRHYLTPARLQRLRAALARERDPEVRRAIEATISGQNRR